MPTQITIPHRRQGGGAAIVATTGTHQATFMGIVMKLNKDMKVSVASAWPLTPIISTEAASRKRLHVFLAMLRC